MIRTLFLINNFRLFISAVLMLPIYGCSNDQVPASFSFGDSTISLDIRSLKEKNVDGKRSYFLYGYVEIFSSDKPLSAFDLNCLTLKVGDKLSRSIYVDSVAHVLKESYKANAQGEIKTSIYWVFDHLDAVPKNSSLELVLDDDKFNSCRQ